MEASSIIDDKSYIFLILSIVSFLVIALGLIAVMGCICCKRRRNNQKLVQNILIHIVALIVNREREREKNSTIEKNRP